MNLKEYRVDAGRMRLAVMEWGNPKGTPVVAFHGWLDNAASFTLLAQSMDLTNIRLIAIDLPGHGLSQHRDAGQIYHLLDYVVDVVGFLKTLQYRQVSLLGHSLGGMIAMLTTAAVPSKVNQLIMLDSLGPMSDREEDVAEQLRKAVSKICLSESRPATPYTTLSNAVDARVGGFSRLNRAAAQLLVERGTEQRDGGYYWSTDVRLRDPSLMRLSERQVEGMMSAIECPVLLIAATKGYISLEDKNNMRLAYISHLEVEKVKGGHHFHMDGDVKRTANLTTEFILSNVSSL